jgi:GAF domain-containing protein
MDTTSLRFLKEEAARLADENADLRRELADLRQSVHALSALWLVSQRITPEVDVRRLLGDILDAALRVAKASDGSLLLVDEATGDLVFTAARGAAADRLVGYRLPKGRGIAGWVARECQPQIVRDVHADPRFFPGVDEAFAFNTRSMVAVPVTLDDGRVLGVIEVLNKASDQAFTQEDLDLILIVAQLAATAMRRAERAIETGKRGPLPQTSPLRA